MSRQMLRRKGGVTSRKAKVAPAEMSVGVFVGLRAHVPGTQLQAVLCRSRKSDSSSVCLATTSKGLPRGRTQITKSLSPSRRTLLGMMR